MKGKIQAGQSEPSISSIKKTTINRTTGLGGGSTPRLFMLLFNNDILIDLNMCLM